MTKTFRAQRYWLKWLCALPLLIPAGILEALLSMHMQSSVLFAVSCALIMGTLIGVYYALADRCRLFWYEGTYTADADGVTVRLRNREYPVRDIREMFGDELNIFFNRYAYLVIETPEKKIKIYGERLHGEQGFADSALFPLMETLLAQHDELTPKIMLNTALEHWYVKKEEQK